MGQTLPTSPSYSSSATIRRCGECRTLTRKGVCGEENLIHRRQIVLNRAGDGAGHRAFVLWCRLGTPSSRAVDIREITRIDPILLEEIGRLRVIAWCTVIEKASELDIWLDAFDPAARHWVVFQGNSVVAAARMTIHPSLDEVPDAESYAGMFPEPPAAPIASLNRLVVHPSARGQGLSKALDQARLEAAERLGCRSALLSTASGPNRVRQVQGWGFEWVGYGPRFIKPPLCHLPPPAVLVCRLPRKTA